MSKTVVLHVGPHKTGSTYLQFRLMKARAALRRHGWEYPEFGVAQFAHHQIYAWLTGRSDDAGIVDHTTFPEMVAKHQRLILSSEDFTYLNRDRLLRLRTLLQGAEVQIVYFIRTPVDLWPSHWQELVRHGHDETLLEYMAAYSGWLPIFDASSMNPISHLGKFSDVFGKASLRLICYDNLAHQKDDMFEYFWRNILKIGDTAPPGEARTIHPSQPNDLIEMVRGLNEVYRSTFQKSPGDRILAAYQKSRKTIEESGDYQDFKTNFETHAGELRLTSSQDFIRQKERTLLNNYKMNIENKASDERLYLADTFDRRIPYAPRYWTDRFGSRAYVTKVFAELGVGES